MSKGEIAVGESGTWVWKDPDARASNLVLFLHGYTGDPESTWARFPELIRQVGQGFDRDFDVASFGYRTHLTHNFQNISTIAALLLAFVDAQAYEAKNIYVIAHSLGGLVARRFLVDTYRSDQDRSFFKKIKQVHFIGVPHEGALVAPGVLDWFRALNPLAAELRRDSPVLLDLLKAWSDTLQQCESNRIRLPLLINYVGNEDWLAPMCQVIGDFNRRERVRVVEGGHLAISKPHHPENVLYTLIKRSILHPTTLTHAASHRRSSDTPKSKSAPNRFQNPYDFAVAARQGMFKGRHAELAEFMMALSNGTHIAVFGLQRMGKTSFVEEAFGRIQDNYAGSRPRPLLARVDLQRFGNDYLTYKSLFQVLATALKEAIGQNRSGKALCADIDKFTASLASYSAAAKMQISYDFAALVERIARAVKSPVVIFLDEFSELCRVIDRNEQLADNNPGRRLSIHPNEMLIDVDLMQTFSSLLKSEQVKRKLVFVFAVRPFMSEFDKRRNLQILKLTKPITLYYLDKEAATALIVEPLVGRLSYATGAVDYLRKLTSGHPYLIQFILKEVVDRKQQSGSDIIELDDIKRVEERMIAEGPAYDAQFDVLDSDHSVAEVRGAHKSLLGKGVLALMANMGEEPDKYWVERDQILARMRGLNCSDEDTTDVLADLVRAKIVREESNGHNLKFRMSIPLLRKRYVTQNMYLKYFRSDARR